MEPEEQVEGDDRPVASGINRELTQILVDVGRRMGFTTVTEYSVPGGRLDVVWLWEPPSRGVGRPGGAALVSPYPEQPSASVLDAPWRLEPRFGLVDTRSVHRRARPPSNLGRLRV